MKAERMSFLSIAEPFLKYSIPVFPLSPKTKLPTAGTHGCTEATTNLDVIQRWNNENPDYNVGIAALPDGDVCFFEFDIKQGMKKAAEEMGESIPVTLTQQSGKGFGHFIFRHTERSRKLGNRSVIIKDICVCDREENRGRCLHCTVKVPHHHHEWFSFRASNMYLVGAGSTHPNGTLYKTMRDVAPIPCPDWVCDYVEKHSDPPVPKPTGSRSLSDDFDFDEFCEHYGISILGVKDEVWHIVEDCPGVGQRHENSRLTGFYYDGDSIGWSCFAQGCPSHDIGIGGLIKLMNRKQAPYLGPIWERDEDEGAWDAKWQVEMDDSILDEEPVVRPVPVAVPEEEFTIAVDEAPAVKPAVQVADYTADVEALVREQKETGERPFEAQDWSPAPSAVTLEDPQQLEGLEFPGDSCMYGLLAEISKSHTRLQSQQGWLYPAHLAVASALDVEDADHHVRSNLYVDLLGEVGDGKTACMKAALGSIALPGENTVIKQSPGSHSGLLNLLDSEEPKPFLLALNELKTVLDACAIQGSRLPQMLCTMWEEDEYGDSVKRGVTKSYGKLSIIGGLAVTDPADFGRLFGSSSVTGMADRFLMGYSTASVAYKPMKVPARFIKVKPVHVAEWVWDAKNQWVGEHRERRRMSEQALRVALVTAAVNGDTEITGPCLEAAFRFCEWQLRLRQRFKPGMAETKEAECYEAVYNALKEAHDRQKASGEPTKGADKITDPDFPREARWKLLNFRMVVNGKSYYRKYAGLIDRVRKSMLESGIIEEYKEPEEEKGKTKYSRTPFVLLRAKVL